jgi:hypothetical protein
MATATVYGTNYTIVANVTPSTALEACKWQGKVRCVEDVCTMAAASDAASILYIGKLPKGAIPIAVILASDTTNGVTAIVGYTGDTDALGGCGTLAASLTGGAKVCVPTVPNTPLTEDKTIYVTTGTAALESASVLHSKILYTVE